MLNCCVTETKDAPLASRIYDVGKIGERAGQPVGDLVDDQVSTRPAAISSSNCCSAGRSIVAPENPTSSYTARRHTQPSGRWLLMKASQTFARCLQRIEFRVEPLLGGFAGVDRAADGSILLGCGSWVCH